MKTNYLKKCLSVLLSIAMLSSLFAVTLTASAAESLTVDGESYQIGDIVELKSDLQVNNWLMNGQVEIPYDTSVLKFVEGQTNEEMFPELTAQGIEVYFKNVESDGVLLFNFSNPTKGVDFTTIKTFYDFKFQVVGAGATELKTAAKIVDMQSFNFEGSPENATDYTMVPVYNEEGTIIEGKGEIITETTPGEAASETLDVDGTTYNVGDEVTLVGELQSEKWLMNTQMELNFDSSKLAFVEAAFPAVEAAGITVYSNYSNEEGWFTFNFSDVGTGVDFTEKAKLYEITFKVVGTGATTLSDNVNIIDMATFPFEGSGADYTGGPYVPVDVTDGNGGVAEGIVFDNAVKEETEEPPVEDTLTVDGEKEYKIGDTFTLVGELQLNKWLMNAQFELPFDNTKVKIINTAYPDAENAGVKVVENADNNNGWYGFNFIALDGGIDFTKGGSLYEVTFEVIGGGETDIAKNANLQVLSTYPFEGSPAENPDEDVYIYNVLEDDGTVRSTEGAVEHVIDPEPPVVEETLNLDGTEYNVGDIVKYNIDLDTINKWVLNGQFTLNFDGTKLKFLGAAYDKLNAAGVKPVDNYSNEEGFFTFNFLEVENGIDFTEGGNLASLQFEVIGTGETSLIDNSYFDVLSTFNFDGSPADPENQGTVIEIVDMTDQNGNINPDYGTINYYYGEPTTEPEGFTVNGIEVKEGDIVEYRVWVKNDDYWLVNSEFDILYTNQYLTLLDVTYPGLEKIEDYIVHNYITDSGLTESQGKPAGEVLFNFSNIHSGADFTEGAYMAILRFEVHESTDPNVPAQGSSVIELNGNVVNDMYVFPFEGSGVGHSIEDKQELVSVMGDDGLPNITEFELETVIIPAIDYSELQAAYDKWSQVDTTGYTPESVAALQEELENAKKILDDLKAGLTDGYTQEMVDQQKADLDAAGEALVVDKSELIALIEEAQAIVDDEETLYVPETIEALKVAIENAQAVVDDENATVEDVAAAILELQAAIDAVKIGAIRGDVDYNGVVNIDDVTLVQMYIAQILDDEDTFYIQLAEMTDDDLVTILDATEIQKVIAALRPVEIVEFNPNA